MDELDRDINMLIFVIILLVLVIVIGFPMIVPPDKTSEKVILSYPKLEEFQTMITVKEEEVEYNDIKTADTLQRVSRMPFKTDEEYLDQFIIDSCAAYGNVDPYLVHSIIYFESRGDKDAVNYDGSCVGLMQLSTKWNAERAYRLGISDFMDPFSNVLIGIDLLSELTAKYPDDPYLVLMLYNMKWKTAHFLYSEGTITDYALNVTNRKEELHARDEQKKAVYEASIKRGARGRTDQLDVRLSQEAT